MLMLGAHEGAYASAALFIALGRKLIGKGVISKEEMSGIVDEAGALLSEGNSISMRQALQLLHWLRKDLGIEDPPKIEAGWEDTNRRSENLDPADG
jgi:hypothetical protein